LRVSHELARAERSSNLWDRTKARDASQYILWASFMGSAKAVCKPACSRSRGVKTSVGCTFFWRQRWRESGRGRCLHCKGHRNAEGRILLREFALGGPKFRRSGFGNPIPALALPELLRTASGARLFRALLYLPARRSLLSACCLQSPEGSLVTDPPAGFDFAFFSERFLFR
jgi:hypothetical protein